MDRPSGLFRKAYYPICQCAVLLCVLGMLNRFPMLGMNFSACSLFLLVSACGLVGFEKRQNEATHKSPFPYLLERVMIGLLVGMAATLLALGVFPFAALDAFRLLCGQLIVFCGISVTRLMRS